MDRPHAMALSTLGVQIAELWNRGGDDDLERMAALDEQVRARAAELAQDTCLAGTAAGRAGPTRADLVEQVATLQELLHGYQQAIGACTRYRSERLERLRALSTGRQAIAGYVPAAGPVHPH